MFILDNQRALNDFRVYIEVGNHNDHTSMSLYSSYGDLNVIACKSSQRCLLL